MLGDDFSGHAHKLEVRLSVVTERGGNADDDGVAFSETAEVGRCDGAFGPEGLRNPLRPDVADVRVGAVERFGLFRIDVEADDGKLRLVEKQRQGQADVTQADHSDLRRALVNCLKKSTQCGLVGYLSGHVFLRKAGSAPFGICRRSGLMSRIDTWTADAELATAEICCPRIAALVELAIEPLDLRGNRVVLLHLPSEESVCNVDFFFNSFGRKDVRVRQLLPAAAKVPHLHEALGDQRFDAVIDLADADAKMLRQLALRCFRMLLEIAQEPISHLVCNGATHGVQWRSMAFNGVQRLNAKLKHRRSVKSNASRTETWLSGR